MRPIESKVYSHLSFGTDNPTDFTDIASSNPLPVGTFQDLVEKVAKLSYHNKDFLLFYRGQDQEYYNRAGNSSFYPSIYRTDPNKNLTSDEILYRFEKLENASQQLVSKFEESEISSLDDLKKRRYIQWSMIQHYEVCDTPLLDLTQSIRVACSFAFKNEKKDKGFFYVFGLPYITNRISRNSEYDLVNIRLINISPPEALRPYFQEGYLVGTDDVTFDYDDKTEFDFKRRLIAKFEIRNTPEFWGDEHQMVRSLTLPNDKIEELCTEIKNNLDKEYVLDDFFGNKPWLLTWSGDGGIHGQERVEVRNNNKYYANGKYAFKLDLVEVDKQNGKIRFRKNGHGSDKRTAINDLNILSPTKIEGIEGKDIRVKYQQMK